MPCIRRLGLAAMVLIGAKLEAQAPPSAEPPPAWAYPIKPPGPPPPADSAHDLFIAPDWHPQEHPVPPDPVQHGRKPGVYACGYCHRIDGSGAPENATLAGLSAAYMTRQIADFRSGARYSSEPLRTPAALMIAVARAATDSEVAAAVNYFAARTLAKRIDVVETDSVPVTHVVGWLLAVAPGNTREPLGPRIIEVPSDMAIFERRDAHARFTAYVPKGSVPRGRDIAEGGGTAPACTLCHGLDLHGVDPAPALAGHSPSYIVRQLWDFKHGARAGSESAPMQAVAAQLSLEDMIAVAAYLASLDP